MLNPTHLRTLREVLRYGSFAVAASRLGYTASAVSQQMSALERATGTALFERTPRSVRPTPMARYLAERGTGVLAAIDQLSRDIATYSPDRVPLHIGCFPSAAIHLLPEALATWNRDGAGGPEIDVNVIVAEPTEMIPMLATLRLVDLVIAYQFIRNRWPPGIRVTRLGDDPMRLLLPRTHPLARKRTLALPDLRDEPWITHAPGAGQSVAAERLHAVLGFYPRIVGHCDNYDATIALVGCGLAVALAPSLATRALPADVVARDIPGIGMGRTLYALAHDDPDSSSAGAIAAFTAHIRDVFARVAPAVAVSHEAGTHEA